jgi:glycosyltransferase involved in cell wall biosynthesis
MIPESITYSKCAIVMTSFGREKLLDDAIRSIREQSFQDFKLYLVDDNSTVRKNTSTKNIILKHAFNDKRIIPILRKDTTDELRRSISWVENINLVLNDLVDRSLCDWVVYSTCDDYKFSNQLQVMDNDLKRTPIVIGRLQFVMAPKWTPTMIIPGKPLNVFTRPNVLGKIDHNGIAHKLEILKGLGRPYWTNNVREQTIPDAIFVNKLLAAGNRAIVTNGIVGLKRLHKNSIGGSVQRWGYTPV